MALSWAYTSLFTLNGVVIFNKQKPLTLKGVAYAVCGFVFEGQNLNRDRRFYKALYQAMRKAQKQENIPSVDNDDEVNKEATEED